jgi:hypothetical protein
LKPHLEAQANERRARAIDQLRNRADQEAAAMRGILETQRARIEQTAAAREHEQPRLDFENERRQLEADKRYWQRRLASLERELDAEPTRIGQSYDVKAARFEPVGLVYLWPVTG